MTRKREDDCTKNEEEKKRRKSRWIQEMRFLIGREVRQ